MDIEKVIQDLNRRFEAPLPEFYKRRIIVWHDEDREFEDKLDDVNIDNVKIVALNGSNAFEVKKLLCCDDTASNYILYCPISYDNPDDNWLTDIELYSEEFRADLISIWMNEMSIASTPELRKTVKTYRKFFNAKERRQKIVAVGKYIYKPAGLHLAIMSAICGIKEPENKAIIRKVLESGLNAETNSVYQDMVSFGANTAFWKLIEVTTGYSEENNDLRRLMVHILLTAVTRTLSEENLLGLKDFIASAYQPYCYEFISDWLHDENASLYNIVREIEEEIRMPERLNKLSVEDISNTECFPCVNEVILMKLMREIKDGLIDVQKVRDIVEKRRTCVWYEGVKNYYEGLYQVTNMHEFYKEFSAGFHTVAPEKIWKEYTENYYKMDTYYRLFHLNFQESLTEYNSNLHDLFNQVTEMVENLYTNWYLKQLGQNWFDAVADELSENGFISSLPQQERFYSNKVKYADTRVFVIISDAMRYEVAATLTEQLRRETQSKVDLTSMQAIFPTVTKFGMAALLPHKELGAEFKNNKIHVLADGQYTGSNYRDKILKQENINSIALNYKDIISKKRAERNELVKGKEVVYIYHDTIDEAAHTSDTLVFPACETAITEIKNLVRIIVNDFGGVNIYITADHGFLYNYNPLTEDDKLDKDGFAEQIIEVARRYTVTKRDAEVDYLMPVKFLHEKTEFSSFTPRENIRIKCGGGLNFVHGGASLQEMVVPVIEYHFLRNDSKEYKRNKTKYDTKPVTVELLSANKKISNMIFSLNFYQKEPVGDNREAATYQMYFTNSNGKQISDIQRIIADKTSENGQERTFRCNFNLKPLKYNKTDTYYLVIEDENSDGYSMLERIEFEIDIAFAVDDFDF